jgi:hypothetical protein
MQKVNSVSFSGLLQKKYGQNRAAAQTDGRQSFLAAVEQAKNRHAPARQAASSQISSAEAERVIATLRDMVSRIGQPQQRTVSAGPATDLNSGPRAMSGAQNGMMAQFFTMEAGTIDRSIQNYKDAKWYQEKGSAIYSGQGDWREGFDEKLTGLAIGYRSARDENNAMGRSNTEIEKLYTDAVKQWNDFRAEVASGKDFGEPGLVRALRHQHASKGEPSAYNPNWTPPEVYKVMYTHPDGSTEWREPQKVS